MNLIKATSLIVTWNLIWRAVLKDPPNATNVKLTLWNQQVYAIVYGIPTGFLTTYNRNKLLSMLNVNTFVQESYMC